MKRMVFGAIPIIGLALWLGTTAALGDEAGIRKTMDAFATAWNAHDSKAMAANFTQDGDLINPAGRAAKGREEIEKLFIEEQATTTKGTTLATTIDSVTPLTADLELMDATVVVKNMTMPDGTTRDAEHHLAAIFKKEGEAWLVLIARPYVFVKH